MAKKTSPRAKKTTRNKGTTPAPLSFKQRIAQFNLKEYLKGDTVKFLVGFLMLAISFTLHIRKKRGIKKETRPKQLSMK